jgi:C_GCAxxG_C_C family probable redox protein
MGFRDEGAIRAMGALGGGIASTGRVCGALLGGVCMISSLYSRSRPEEKEHPNMWRLSYKLTKKFEELTQEYGSVNCGDIAQVNWRDREQVAAFYGNPEGRRARCIRLVEDTAAVLGRILEEAEQEKKE